MTRIAYTVNFRYGHPNLAEVLVQRETDKTYTLKRIKNIYGTQWFGKRTHKSKVRLFDDIEDAIACLTQLIKEYNQQLADKQVILENFLFEVQDRLDRQDW